MLKKTSYQRTKEEFEAVKEKRRKKKEVIFFFLFKVTDFELCADFVPGGHLVLLAFIYLFV